MSTDLHGARTRCSQTVALLSVLGLREEAGRSRAEAFNQMIFIFLNPGGRVGEGQLPTEGSIEASRPYNLLYLAVLVFSTQFINLVALSRADAACFRY